MEAAARSGAGRHALTTVTNPQREMDVYGLLNACLLSSGAMLQARAAFGRRRGLFVSKRYYWIDAHGAPGWQIRREQGDRKKQK